MKGSSRIIGPLPAKVGRVKYSKVVFIRGFNGGRVYVGSESIPKLIEDLKRVKKEVEDDEKA